MAAMTARKPVSGTPQIKATHASGVRRDLLQHHYQYVATLREYLLCKLPSSSRLRRRKIAQIGAKEVITPNERKLANLLDTTLVGCDLPSQQQDPTRWATWLSFSQRPDDSHVTVSGGLESAMFCQRELVDFVIWLLFERENRPGHWPRQLICDGFRRGNPNNSSAEMNIPGVFCVFDNANAAALREDPWPQVLALLGRAGERIMIDLLIDCAIFLRLSAGYNNYYQINGTPLYETTAKHQQFQSASFENFVRKPSEIVLVRSRAFYGKPSLNAAGFVQAGLKPIHILNRARLFPSKRKQGHDANLQDDMATSKVMMYMFPRQFHLHNAFTSTVDQTETSHKFKDYTIRDGEISTVLGATADNAKAPKVPKRLRGETWRLIRQLQINHRRCSYHELLNHYCSLEGIMRTAPVVDSLKTLPPPTVDAKTPRLTAGLSWKRKQHDAFRSHTARMNALLASNSSKITDLACSHNSVALFCRAVLSTIIPLSFWGLGDEGKSNRRIFEEKLRHFIALRRFESMSLHEVLHNIKLQHVSWLQSPATAGQKTCQAEARKRHELFAEFLYFVLDSLLIPLLRNNFYVTESNLDRYEVFYFRQDVWKSIATPAITNLKHAMLEDFDLSLMEKTLAARQLGCTSIRLLPKGNKLRPITNLKRREMSSGKTRILQRSINSILKPAHTMLQLERVDHPNKLGASMFSVGDMYWRIKDFRQRLMKPMPKLFFAKVDVQSAFDTIPQEEVLALIRTIPSESKFRIHKHAEVSAGERPIGDVRKIPKPISRWHMVGKPIPDNRTLYERAEGGEANKKKNAIYVGSAVVATKDTRAMLDLISEHVGQNLVKINGKVYRQKQGIPQGSVLSSFLCSYFYADMEQKHLGFLQADDCLLIRLIDDFLLITADESKAKRFVQIMHGGFPEYGVQVSAKKTLVNFDMTLGGNVLSKTSEDQLFPYCGTLINCETLDISKDRQRSASQKIANSLTVEYGRAPGQNFQRKVLNSFKLQSNQMFFDTSHNSTQTVISTLRGAFSETASKMCAYERSLSAAQRAPSAALILQTVLKTIEVAHLIITSHSRKLRHKDYQCHLRRDDVYAAGYDGFIQVLCKKQTIYKEVLAELRGRLEKIKWRTRYKTHD